MSLYFADEYTSARPLHQRQSEIMEGRAKDELLFGRVVYHNGTGFVLADPITGLFSGISVRRRAPAGAAAMVLPAGTVESKDWSTTAEGESLEPGRSYFLQTEGRIGLVPPAEGAIIRVGRATSQKVLLVTFDLKIL